MSKFILLEVAEDKGDELAPIAGFIFLATLIMFVYFIYKYSFLSTLGAATITVILDILLAWLLFSILAIITTTAEDILVKIIFFSLIIGSFIYLFHYQEISFMWSVILTVPLAGLAFIGSLLAAGLGFIYLNFLTISYFAEFFYTF